MFKAQNEKPVTVLGLLLTTEQRKYCFKLKDCANKRDANLSHCKCKIEWEWMSHLIEP